MDYEEITETEANNSEMEESLKKWKKLVRDISRPLRYSDAYRDGWRAATWHIKQKKK